MIPCKNDSMYIIDELAEQAGGYFAMPFQDDMAYTDLLFDICQQFGIRYYSATPKVKGICRGSYSCHLGKKNRNL